MYTGIVTGTFPLLHVERREASATLALGLDTAHLADLQTGASVALDGVCMTVTRIDEDRVWFDASGETLRLTTLGQRKSGDRVNVERSARAGAEVGGHAMSGHIDGMAEIIDVARSAENTVLTFRLPENLRRYVFNKGYVGLNGCSLTVANLDKMAGTFEVHLIPETLRLTTYDTVQAGDWANVEIDRQTQIIVETVYEAVHAALREAMPGR